MKKEMTSQYQMEEMDLDFNIEEMELIVAPDVAGQPVTTSIISICQCN
jgi:hypothetical protein